MNKTFKVGIYIRLSREDGDKLESESVSNQRNILQRYIKENEYILIDEYVDDFRHRRKKNQYGYYERFIKTW